jgi:CheY-like chemotaxis protein
MGKKRVLNVGQCAADNWSIARTLTTHFEADVVPAATAREALDRLRQEKFDLVLVNRLFDADGGSGIEFVKQAKGDDKLRETPVMLVSNHADAQREAIEAGAVQGFGKAALDEPEMLETLRPHLG